MKKFAKVLCILLGLCLCLGGIVACDKKSNGGEIVISVWVPEEDMNFAKSVAEDFKRANPDNTYDFQWAAQTEMNAATQVLTDVEAAADVYSFANDQLFRLVSGDALAQIGGTRLTALKEANSEEAVAAASVSKDIIGGDADKTYAFPYTDNTFFLFYNKSKFSEEDIKTLDGILARCSAAEQFAFPMQDGWYNSSFFFGAGLGYEVTYTTSLNEKSVTIDFDNATGIDVTQTMYDYARNPGFKADAGDSNITAGFQAGTVIAAATGIWNYNAIKNYLGDNLGLAKLPTYTLNGEQKQLIAFAGYKMMGVNKHSKQPAAAMDFAAFYTNKQSQLKHFEARNFLPCNLEARQEDAVKNNVCAQAIAEQLQHSKSQIAVPTNLYEPLKGLGTAITTATGWNSAEAQITAAMSAVRK